MLHISVCCLQQPRAPSANGCCAALTFAYQHPTKTLADVFSSNAIKKFIKGTHVTKEAIEPKSIGEKFGN